MSVDLPPNLLKLFVMQKKGFLESPTYGQYKVFSELFLPHQGHRRNHLESKLRDMKTSPLALYVEFYLLDS